MNTTLKLAAVFAALAITPALAGPADNHCGQGTEGMRARMKTINEQMDRIEVTTDSTKQRELLDLHMKHMQEGARELRKREMPESCRMELMSAMMESMIRHQQVREDTGAGR